MTHAGVRWNRVSRAATGWIAGTIWMADAPVPITATRLPARSARWSHRAEWKISPGNVSSPGMSGVDGVDRGPAAAMTTSAVRSPRDVRSRHWAALASQRAPASSVPNRMYGRIPYRSVTASR